MCDFKTSALRREGLFYTTFLNYFRAEGDLCLAETCSCVHKENICARLTLIIILIQYNTQQK